MNLRKIIGTYCEQQAGRMASQARSLSRRSDLTEEQRERLREKADYYQDLKESYKLENKMNESEDYENEDYESEDYENEDFKIEDFKNEDYDSEEFMVEIVENGETRFIEEDDDYEECTVEIKKVNE